LLALPADDLNEYYGLMKAIDIKNAAELDDIVYLGRRFIAV
jgi:hypothetical protein